MFDAPTTLAKRIVVKHPSGLWQIVGETEAQPEAFVGLEAQVSIGGEPVCLNLVAARPRYYLYTVVQAPATTPTLHSQQR